MGKGAIGNSRKGNHKGCPYRWATMGRGLRVCSAGLEPFNCFGGEVVDDGFDVSA